MILKSRLTQTLIALMLTSSQVQAQEQITVTKNVQYDEHKSCVLDVARPVSEAPSPRPAIIIIHGGGWSAGGHLSLMLGVKNLVTCCVAVHRCCSQRKI